MKKGLILLTVAVLALALAGCFPGTSTYTPREPAGFFSGVWHGWIAPVSLIVGFFRPDIRIYETYNTGWWYDFGYYIAVIAGFGGITLSRKRKKKDRS
jgi:polyferredoxin